MRILLIGVSGVVLLVISVIVIGSLLPKQHVVKHKGEERLAGLIQPIKGM